MAIFQLQIKSLSRAKGANAVAAAAYISREKLRDQQRHKTFDFRRVGGLQHSEILTPQHQQGQPRAPAPQRAELWNQAEQAERRRNSRVAREYQFSLPHELKPEARIALARRFAQDIADRHGSAVDLAVHSAPPGGDRRNVHAHVLSTTREYHPEGLGRKTGIEISDTKRRERGLPAHGREEYLLIRARWAQFANEALRDHGISARIDHRRLAEQGIERRPQTHRGKAVTEIMRRGGHSYVAERIQAEQAAERAALLERERIKTQSQSLNSLESRRRRALESWQAYRQQERSAEAGKQQERDAHEAVHEAGRAADRDFER